MASAVWPALMASWPSRTSSFGVGVLHAVDLLAQSDRLGGSSLPLADDRERLEGRQAIGRFGDDPLEQRHGPLPLLAARVVQREVGADILGVGGDLGGPGQTPRAACFSCPRAECAVARLKSRVEVLGIFRQDLLQQRDRPRVLLASEEAGRLLEEVEEPAHVGRARRVLAHDGRDRALM